MEKRKADVRQMSLAELSPRMQRSKGVAVSLGQGKVPGHILDAERAMKQAQEYRQALDSAVGPGNLSHADIGRSGGGTSRVGLATPAASYGQVREMETYLNTAISGSYGQGAKPPLIASADQEGMPGPSLLNKLGVASDRLRDMGLSNKNIDQLYRGLYTQAVTFQQLVDEQMAGLPGNDAEVRSHLLASFHDLSRKLLEAQENDLRILHDSVLLDGTMPEDLNADVMSPLPENYVLPQQLQLHDLAGKESPAASEKSSALPQRNQTKRPLAKTSSSGELLKKNDAVNDFLSKELELSMEKQTSAESQIQVLNEALSEARNIIDEMQGEQDMVNLENQHLREQATSNEAQIAQLSSDVESKAGNLLRDFKALQNENEKLQADVEAMSVDIAVKERETEAERKKVRTALRDKALVEERAQKHKESETTKEFMIRMLEAQLTDISNDHVRKLDEQLTRFKKDMDDYTESRRRLRAAEADLEGMRALYLDETQTHARTTDEKVAVEYKLKKKEEELVQKEQTVQEKDREIEELKNELAQAGGSREDLENELQMYQEKIKKMSELEKKASVATQRLNNARAEAEHVRAQGRHYISDLQTRLTQCQSDLKHAYEGMLKERASKDEYRIKFEAVNDKVRAMQDHVASMLDEMEDIYKKTARAEAAAEDLEASNSGMQARMERLEYKIQAKEDELKDVHQQKTQLVASLELETNRVAAREEQNIQLQKDVDNLHVEIKHLQEQVDSGAVAKEDLSRTKAELQRVSTNYSVVSSEYNDMQKRVNDYSNENATLKHQIEVSTNELEMLRQEVEQLQEENTELKVSQGSLMADLEKSTAEGREKDMQISFLKAQAESMHGNQKKATAELTEKRTMLSELQVIHEAMMTELTSTKKRLNVAEISLAQANKIRDRLRLELQAAKSQLEVATSGIEATLYSIEVERNELSEMMTSVKENQSRALSRLQDVFDGHPDVFVSEDMHAILLSLRDVEAEVGVQLSMIDAETELQKDLRDRVIASGKIMETKLAEARLAARGASLNQGEDGSVTESLDDVTLVEISKADLDKQTAMVIASGRDAAQERERANRESARRVAALEDLERGLKEVAHQRDLLAKREDMWKEDLRRMEQSTAAAQAQAKMREEFSQRVIDRNKELEKELQEEKLKNQYVSSDEAEEDLAHNAEDAHVAEADGAAAESEKAEVAAESPTDENQGTQDPEPQGSEVVSTASEKPSRKPKTPPHGEPCLHCGQSAGEGHARRGRIKKGENLVLEKECAAQTDEVELWVRNHDVTQEHAFDTSRDLWMRELSLDEAEFIPMSFEKLIRNIRQCYEAKVRCDAVALRDQKRNPRPLHDVIYDMYMQKYGTYETAIQQLVLLAASVRAHAETEPEVVLFGLSSRILHESTISQEMFELLELGEQQEYNGHDATTHSPKESGGSLHFRNPAAVSSKIPLPRKPKLPDEARGIARIAEQTEDDQQILLLESESAMIRMDVWDLLDQVGVGIKTDDPDAPVSSHRAAWKSIASHMLGIPARSVLSSRPEETLVVHGLMKWFIDVALSTPGMPGLIAAMSTYDFHEDVQQCNFGVQVTATHVPQLWYLAHEIAKVLRLRRTPSIYVQYGPEPRVYYLEVAPLVKLGNDSYGETGPVPWQRRPCLIVTSGALSVLNPSELQAAMACALAPHLAPGGEGMSLEERRRTKDRTPTLSSLATLCSLAEIFPEVLLRKAPPSVARFWSTGLGPTLLRLRDNIAMCGDRTSALVVQDLRTVVHTILKMSTGRTVLDGALNPDAILEETYQTDEITLKTHRASGEVAVDLISSRFSHPTLRVRELAKFMDSGAYLSAVEGGTPLLSTVEIASSVLDLDVPQEIPTYPADEESTPPRTGQQPGPLLYRVKSATGAMMRKRLDKLRAVQNASISEEHDGAMAHNHQEG